MLDNSRLPYTARDRFVRIAMERWGIVADAIQEAIIDCRREGRSVKQHFFRFVDNDGKEDYRMDRYGLNLVEKHLFSRQGVKINAEDKENKG